MHMAVSRILSRGWFAWAAALLLAPAAGALDITGLTPTINTPPNSVNAGPVSGNNGSQTASATSITLAPGGAVPDTVGQAITFQTRYTELLAIDRDNPGSGQTANMTSDYSITFTVSNPTGVTYRLDIDTLRAGALTVVGDDASGGSNASAGLGAVTGRVDGIVDAALAMAVVPAFTSTSTGMSGFNQTTGVLSITDNALSRSFTLNFTWTSTATTSNDEAAVRMGINGGITSATADDYPGAGGLARTQANDGHFVNVTTTIISVPEPAPAALIALGLVALVLRGRRARQ
jgi:hypothetical protein